MSSSQGLTTEPNDEAVGVIVQSRTELDLTLKLLRKLAISRSICQTFQFVGRCDMGDKDSW